MTASRRPWRRERLTETRGDREATSCPARRLGRLRPALAAGTGIAADRAELLRVVVDHPGGVVQLVRAGGRLAFVVIETARPGARVVFRIAPGLEWAADRFGRILAGGFA